MPPVNTPCLPVGDHTMELNVKPASSLARRGRDLLNAYTLDVSRTRVVEAVLVETLHRPDPDESFTDYSAVKNTIQTHISVIDSYGNPYNEVHGHPPILV
ncbi:MAG: hypothetical protein UW76_C0035G0003 [Parcubacteria group bacterium GW2011_GWF2_44_8b]|nr:MAG: hypothetical protein UV94_C0001G0030 [Parcubacteria group bacterium GW2011_GWC1_43_30]KKT79173.1 MAG: hypothetical protein UW76_C0035G0003 [Parcubacteria group bacterium GW2011_GWF2_44_8b]